MRTAFCPLCNSGVSVVLREQQKKEWKVCPNCGEPCYVELSQEHAKVVALQEVVDNILTKPAGKNLIGYLLKHQNTNLQDLLFNSSKALEPNIIYMAELGVLDKDQGRYTLHSQLKCYIQEKYNKL